MDRFVVNGAAAGDVIATLQNELAKIRSTYERDPDPADDPEVIEEPSNNWPGAEFR